MHRFRTLFRAPLRESIANESPTGTRLVRFAGGKIRTRARRLRRSDIENVARIDFLAPVGPQERYHFQTNVPVLVNYVFPFNTRNPIRISCFKRIVEQDSAYLMKGKIIGFR